MIVGRSCATINRVAIFSGGCLARRLLTGRPSRGGLCSGRRDRREGLAQRHGGGERRTTARAGMARQQPGGGGRHADAGRRQQRRQRGPILAAQGRVHGNARQGGRREGTQHWQQLGETMRQPCRRRQRRRRDAAAVAPRGHHQQCIVGAEPRRARVVAAASCQSPVSANKARRKRAA